MKHRGFVVAAIGLAASIGATQSQEMPPTPRVSVIAAAAGRGLELWAPRLVALERAGELRVREELDDTMMEGRRNARLEQRHHGLRVWGGEVTRQSDSAGPVTAFGNFYEGVAIDTKPQLSENAARRAIEAVSKTKTFFPDEVELIVLPREAAGGLEYRLAWRGRVVQDADIRMIFIDAQSGETLLDYSDLQTQAAVGRATGVLGDQKKMSVTSAANGFQAQDALRPPPIQTLDMKGNLNRLNVIFNTFPGGIAPSDYAADSDNDWTDGPTVDAHAYAGYTYDYYFKRFNRRGLNNQDIAVRSFVHPVRREDVLVQPSSIVGSYYVNAFYAGIGVMVYGEGLPTNLQLGGQRWNYMAGALDVVAHELTHGVTDYTSRLIYQGESGALNEAFSDIMGTAIEFFYQPVGTGPMTADYFEGEDVVTAAAFPLNGIRSLQNPGLFDDPDHYSIRFTGTGDNGGVHINSGIANHAYYLAIEGGTHRLGGRVTGVGQANREQIERVFYRAFTVFLGPSSNFAAARVATIQAARDLYPTNPAVEAAITQAWNAVGVN